MRNLSGGNQQKVILARWLLRGSPDPHPRRAHTGNRREREGRDPRLLGRITEKGLSVILISSELEEVIENSDRIIVLHEGRQKGQLDPKLTTQAGILKVCLT